MKKNDYDIVIGNPPWESRLSQAAQKYLKDKKYRISDKQIAQAFTWRAGEICPNGVICLLLPSKSFLFNRSDTARQFRAAFFDKYNVSVIINYSAFRWVLFEHAVSPAVGVIYSNSDSNKDAPLFYCTPKPLYTIEDKRRFLIEPSNIFRIPRELVYDDLIWKIAMWGNPRDMDLIYSIQNRCISFRRLFDENDIVYAEGYKRGNRKKNCTDFLGMPVLNARTFQPGITTPNMLPQMQESKLECTVETKRQIFEVPHLIIKQSHKGTHFLADVLHFDAVFNHSFLGAHGNERILKYCCLMIRSKVFSYYQMMTNRKWLVERDEVEAGDILDAPVPRPDDVSLTEAEALFYKLSIDEDLDAIDQFAYRQYQLYPYETALIDDAIGYVYDFYTKRGQSITLLPPNDTTFNRYFYILKEVLNNTLGNNIGISCRVHKGDAPLIVVELNLSQSFTTEFAINHNPEEMDSLLRKLDNQLLEERSSSVYVKRNVRIYNRDSICIIKPNQTRYWNYSSACRDADEIYADVMRVWRSENE